jgi:uncharacterized protein YbjT (DUF2867 family)
MILVIGATGTVGGRVLVRLREAGTAVTALVRDPFSDAGRALRDAGVEVAIGDLERPETLASALGEVDHVFLMVPSGPRQVEQAVNAIEAARHAGVQGLVMLSCLLAAEDSPVAFGRAHWRGEQHLARSGLAYTILRPNYYMHNLAVFASGVRERRELRAPAGDARVSMVDPADVAAVADRALTEAGHTGQTLVLTGPQALSFAEVAEQLSLLVGATVRYVPSTPEEERRRLRAAGAPAWLAEDTAAMYDLLRAGAGAAVTPVVADLVGAPPRPFADFAREHRDLWLGA